MKYLIRTTLIATFSCFVAFQGGRIYQDNRTIPTFEARLDACAEDMAFASDIREQMEVLTRINPALGM